MNPDIPFHLSNGLGFFLVWFVSYCTDRNGRGDIPFSGGNVSGPGFRSLSLPLLLWMVAMDRVHVVFGALHATHTCKGKFQSACCLMNVCFFPFSLPPCYVLSEDNYVEGGCFLPCFPKLFSPSLPPCPFLFLLFSVLPPR